MKKEKKNCFPLVPSTLTQQLSGFIRHKTVFELIISYLFSSLLRTLRLVASKELSCHPLLNYPAWLVISAVWKFLIFGDNDTNACMCGFLLLLITLLKKCPGVALLGGQYNLIPAHFSSYSFCTLTPLQPYEAPCCPQMC